ncbi:VanW family protein [Actinophytocola oryzae]|uniref:Vancomycin resistance protein YoaR n=1 Tax=Actinophytocola oryzae TaxID=502181 RepID=A0A4R7VMA3_9PSEU|nr:VanW family protein [Actinophytocola oryzae]TDV50730.1 vancomycin resistance protein YoaR [Actinophytocola oryzae]
MEHRWPESHAEQTDVLTPITRTPGDEPTVRIPAEPVGDESTAKDKSKRLRRIGLVAAGVIGVLAVIYGVDVFLSSGEVPRGVTVAGVEVGGESHGDAERILRDELEPRLGQPVKLVAGDVDVEVRPADAGLAIDWAATVAQAGDQPLNPITRLTSLFSSREVGVVSTKDDKKLDTAIEGLRAKTDREPAEGGIRFEGVNPVAVDPKPGQKLDVPGAEKAVVDGWASGQRIKLPVAVTKVRTTADGVRKAVDDIAKPAVAGPVVIHGEGKDATLEPEAIAGALVFQPADGGGLSATLDQNKLVGALGPQLSSTEVEGKDAQIVFSGGAPKVEPSVDGKGVDWAKTLTPLMDTLRKPEGREVKAEYAPKPAKVTTDAANKLGIKEVIGEFSTGGFAQDSGVNIKTVAAKVNGAIVAPGETFSLNGYTGPRTRAQGYVEAGAIKDGAPGREVGGGISQFATTLYNAAYFSAMKDAGHKEHSYYISRYPAAREATVFQNPDGSSVIDLKFTNDSDTGVAIQTIWTSSSITVKLWGTKHFEVESVPGGRTNQTEPQTKQGPAENCHAGNGAPGFTTSDTRIIREVGSGREVSRKTRTVKYNPQPKIVCGTPPPGG